MKRLWTQLVFALIAILICAGTARPVHAQFTYTKLHDFGDGSVTNDGASSQASLIQGADGNFYGTTASGGSANKGTIFKVTPTGTVTILHSFGDGSVVEDGVNPSSALLQGVDGNFYGITEYGGAPIPGQGAGSGVGTVFKMTPAGVVTILHSFGPGCLTGDGARPRCLTQTSDGTLYGGTYTSGNAAYPHGFGIVFSISPSGTYTILHVNALADGAGVVGLLAYPDGNLYGIDVSGGGSSFYANGQSRTVYGGTFFKVTPSGLHTVLVDFPVVQQFINSYAISPADFYLAADGTFYFYTFGNNGPELTAERPDDGSPIFSTYGHDGGVSGPFTIDPYGNLYTSTSGTDGYIYAATPNGTNSIAHTFTGTDGSTPNAVVLGSDGDLYGTTSAGGSAGKGVIFKLHNAVPFGSATTLVVTPNYVDPLGAEPGSPFDFTVTALDGNGRVAAGYTGTVQFGSNNPEVLPTDATLINGTGAFQATFYASDTLYATDSVTPSITGRSQITIQKPPYLQITLPAAVTPGVPFNVTVTARDSDSSVAVGYSGTVRITTTDSAATLPPNAKLTKGIGTFTVTLRTGPNNQLVYATDTVASSIVGDANTYVPGPATRFTITAPSYVVKGKAFTVWVYALDSNNRAATGYAGTVHFTSSQGGATLPADAKLTDGVGMFSVTLTATGRTTITATDAVTPGVTGTFGPIDVALTQFAAGWQMAVTPFSSGSVSSLFVYLNGNLTAYNGSGYIPVTTVEAGLGFWIDPSTSINTLLLQGAVNQKPTSHPLHAGWNIIGDPYLTPEPASSMTVNGKPFLSQSDLIAQVTYTFQAGDTAYETATGSVITLQPFEGYWVYAYSQCTVTFN